MANAKASSDISGQSFYIGLDIGSVSLNTVLLDDNYNIIEDHYDYVHGKPFNMLYDRLSSVLEKYPSATVKGIALTGTGGKLAAGLIGGVFVNEIIAQATSAGRLFPDARTVIEIGGEVNDFREKMYFHATTVIYIMTLVPPGQMRE